MDFGTCALYVDSASLHNGAVSCTCTGFPSELCFVIKYVLAPRRGESKSMRSLRLFEINLNFQQHFDCVILRIVWVRFKDPLCKIIRKIRPITYKQFSIICNSYCNRNVHNSRIFCTVSYIISSTF